MKHIVFNGNSDLAVFLTLAVGLSMKILSILENGSLNV